jgi:hypothetical protein
MQGGGGCAKRHGEPLNIAGFCVVTELPEQS